MTLKDDPKRLTLRVGSHVFRVRCPVESHVQMKNAAAAVEREYEHVRRREKIADGERAALMVALKMASGSPTAASRDGPELDALIGECMELATSQPDG